MIPGNYCYRLTDIIILTPPLNNLENMGFCKGGTGVCARVKTGVDTGLSPTRQSNLLDIWGMR